MVRDNTLVKYCFSKLETRLPDKTDEYYSAIICELEADGIIKDIYTFEFDSPFDDEKLSTIYQIEACEKYCYSFFCSETRNDEIVPFEFSIKFSHETHEHAELLYVEICSLDYTFTTESDSNCLEVLKHTLRSKIKGWENRYCLVDKQSTFYATKLYPQIYEVENFFRFYVNDVFTKVFGHSWWNEAIAINIKKNRQERIEDTREYAGAYRDVQPYLMSLELSDLMSIANTKTLRWVPTHDSKIEGILNHYSDSDLIPLLKAQCQTQLDIWNMCFAKHLNEGFSNAYRTFEKRRNQIAHNKLLDYESFQKISTLCELVSTALRTAHAKFCEGFISEEEQRMIAEYNADMAMQEELEREALDGIAESESGVKVYSKPQITDLFYDVLQSLHQDVSEIFVDREDIEFDDLPKQKTEEKQQAFRIHSRICNNTISIYTESDINDSPGDPSTLKLECVIEGQSTEIEIHFVNGEYSFNYEQSCYMPETKDELDDASVEEAKQCICDFVEKHFANLRNIADLQNHLDAMGKSSAITKRDLYCNECGEEYICIDEEYAPIGTCLNCGAKNHIIYCTNCECPIEAVDIEEKDEEPHYCPTCNEKLFGDE